MSEYRVNKRINKDIEYYGFKFRTRRNFFDKKIIEEVLSGRTNYFLPENPKIIIDIGANIGAFSLLAAKAGAEVYAFEPEKFNYEVLCHNVEINGYSNRIHSINLGVGASGEAKLYLHEKNSGAPSSYLTTSRDLEELKYQTVNFISIHDVFNHYKIDYCDVLKLDCEGSEKDIIGDLDNILFDKIGQIDVEFHGLGKWLRRKLRRWYKKEEGTGHPKLWVFKKI